MTDRPPVHTKTAHFCRQILKTIDFGIGALTGTFWKRYRVSTQKMIKKNIFQCFRNETDRFLECRYISLASKYCNEYFTVRFPTAFKLLRYHVSASSNLATVTFFHRFQNVPASCERRPKFTYISSAHKTARKITKHFDILAFNKNLNN